ncbi:MAG: Rrf2 family transcriptional regulator [Spongiibacteraceae bacterium]
MQLTKQTDFAFRTLIYLAHAPAGELQQIRKICEYYDVPQNHISKIVVKLAKLGWVRAVRGKGGGICLGADPSAINLAAVVREFESVFAAVNCEEPLCQIAPNCHLQGILAAAMQGFLDALSQYSLSDLITDKISLTDVQVLEVR